MKIAASILFLLIPVVVVAQNYKGMNEGDMQKMMEQMQMMEACMRNIDQAELKELERRTNQIEDEVKSLCASGNRDEAQEIGDDHQGNGPVRATLGHPRELYRIAPIGAMARPQ